MKRPVMKRAVAVTGLFLMLTGCLSTADPYAIVDCPTIGVLDDAAEISRFRYGGDRDVSDLTYHGQISRVEFTCLQPEGKNVVIARAEIHTRFERGLAASSDRATFKLFVAVSEREDRVVKKSFRSIDVTFKEGERVTTKKTVIKNIKVPSDGTVAPELYNIYFGFQLTPAEVAYNRTSGKF